MEYQNCWFEITSLDGARMMLTRDHEDFVERKNTLSRLHGIMTYKIERTARGLVKTRIFLNG